MFNMRIFFDFPSLTSMHIVSKTPSMNGDEIILKLIDSSRKNPTPPPLFWVRCLVISGWNPASLGGMSTVHTS